MQCIREAFTFGTRTYFAVGALCGALNVMEEYGRRDDLESIKWHNKLATPDHLRIAMVHTLAGPYCVLLNCAYAQGRINRIRRDLADEHYPYYNEYTDCGP